MKNAQRRDPAVRFHPRKRHAFELSGLERRLALHDLFAEDRVDGAGSVLANRVGVGLSEWTPEYDGHLGDETSAIERQRRHGAADALTFDHLRSDDSTTPIAPSTHPASPPVKRTNGRIRFLRARSFGFHEIRSPRGGRLRPRSFLDRKRTRNSSGGIAGLQCHVVAVASDFVDSESTGPAWFRTFRPLRATASLLRVPSAAERRSRSRSSTPRAGK